MEWNCHIHMVLDGFDWRGAIRRHAGQPDEDWIRGVLETYRRQGIRYLRDGGDKWGVGKRARELAAGYAIRYRTPLAPICKAGCYGGFIGVGYEGLKDYASLVKQHREEGADFIKIMISGLMDFHRFGVLTQESLDPREIRELIHIAHQEGFSVMAHGNGAKAVTAAARAGVDSIEHGAYLDGEALAAMAENGTVWVPTLSTIGNLRGRGRFPEDQIQAILESALENIRVFSALGGRIAPGDDAGAWAVPHGCGTEEDLLALALGEKTAAALEQGAAAIMEKF